MAVGGSSVSEVREAEPAASGEHGALPAVAAGVDPPPAEAAADAVDSDDSEVTNWVEMPLSHLRWVLARTRETDPVPTLEQYGIYTEEDLERKDPDTLIRRMIARLQADQDEFFEYQAWVREVYERNGRVMVPEDLFGPTDELNKALAEIWANLGGDANADADAADADADDPEPEASDTTDSSSNQVLTSEL